MAVLVLLGSTFAFAYPLNYFGQEGTYTETLSRVTLFAGITFIPGIIFAAFVGSRTYRVEKGRARKTGAGIGATLGLICFLFLDLDGWESVFRLNWPGGTASFFAPVSLVAIGLILYALSSKGDYTQQRLIVFVAAGITVAAGALVIVLEPGVPNIARLPRLHRCRNPGRNYRRSRLRPGRWGRDDPTRSHHRPARTFRPEVDPEH